MKNYLYAGALLFLFIAGMAENPSGFKKQDQISFIENKGQVCDQYAHARPDILYSGASGKLNFYLKANGISYQLTRTDSWKDMPSRLSKHQTEKVPDQSTIYRLDVTWLNCNAHAEISKGIEQADYTNYYNAGCPQGITQVASYSTVLYKNIYEGIDLKWYEKEGQLKYDYLVAAGADYSRIRFEYKGAKSISVNKAGELVIETSLGRIVEQAPLVMQSGIQLSAAWRVKNNSVSFSIQNLNSSQPFVIDPAVRIWGTYYGGSAIDAGYCCATDANGNIYMTGLTQSSAMIATAGSYQTTLGGLYDAMLVKFNSAGACQWSTYYGGSGNDVGYSCALSGGGALYVCGYTESSNANVIATAGSHQSIYGGSDDAFLVKFDLNGIRQWGTYYGDTNFDLGFSCCTDAGGNVYMSGFAGSSYSTSIATSGAYQQVYSGGSEDAFLVKFNGNGVRQWGTYYGGSGNDEAFSCVPDPSGNIYIAGITSSPSGLATLNAFQTVFGGSNDCFLAKFSNTGNCLWGTYYGAAGNDIEGVCVPDASGSVYLGCVSSSATGLVTPGAQQTIFGGGNYDFLLAKFNGSGTLQWSTYYGGAGDEDAVNMAIDASNTIYLAGDSNSGNGISTAGTYQASNNGNTDACLVAFNSSGILQWGTYYGGVDADLACFTFIGPAGEIYLTGITSSSTGISSPGSQQPTYGGAQDAFLARFTDCNGPSAPTNITPAVNLNICTGQTTTLSATSTYSIAWYATTASTMALSTASSITTPTLSTGVYDYYVEAVNSCGASSLTVITVTVNSPVVTVNSGSICAGQSYLIMPYGTSGTATYSITGNSFTVSPVSTMEYTVTGGATAGCSSSAVATVTVNSLPVISVNSGSVCPGQWFVITPSGAATYTITGGSFTVSPIATTNYYITGTSAEGCLSSNLTVSQVTLAACSVTTGIQAVSGELQLAVYPNPNTGEFTVSMNTATNTRFEIYTSLGQLIYQGIAESEHSALTIKNYEPGIYFLRVLQNGKPIKEEKIIKN